MEFKGKTVEEAVLNGLLELNITKEEAEITVKEEPTKGLFGRIKGMAVVEIEKIEKKEVKEESENVTFGKEKEFLENLLKILKLSATIEESVKDGNPVYTLVTDKSSSVIGYRGEVLDAMQTLVGAVANIGKKDYQKIVVDCEDYRSRREDTLIKLAHKLEEKATESRREVHLEPMNPFERRIIHTALAESTTVKTKSDGKEPNRFVIIVPNDLDEYSTPYNAGANRDKERRSGNRKHSNGKFQNKERSGRSGFSEQRKKSSMGFGAYLGNSLKDKF